MTTRIGKSNRYFSRIHKQAEQGQKTAKDYFRPAKPTPSIYDSDLKRVAVYARVSTSSEEQISSIENQTLYYTKKIAETENWNVKTVLTAWIQRVDVFSFKVHANGMCQVHGFQGRDLRHAI